METTNVTEFLVRWLLVSAALIYSADSKPFTAYTSQHFNGVPSPIPSFVYYRDQQPPTQQKLFFAPINTPYSQYLASSNLRDSVQQSPLPSTVRLSILNPGLRPQNQNAYEIREENRFSTLGDNGFTQPTTNGIFTPPINNPGFLLQRNNGFATSVGNNFVAPNGVLQSLGQQGPPPSHQISLLRYASGFSQPGNHQNELDKALMSLSPTFQQRQRSVATAGELVYRQQRAGSKPFLSADSEGVQREGGEELSSPGGYLGQPYRRPTFVSAVGTPVSGVGQNPLYTGDSIQASKLDEASDVKGVKNPGGIPAPGRLPISHDVHLARPFNRYANSFGYSLREDPPFGSVAPSLGAGRAPFILPPEDYPRGVINR